jgi:hypothetical protein
VGTNVFVALTGVAGTGAAGSLQVQRTNAILGQIAAGAAARVGVDNWILIDNTQDPGWVVFDTSII